MNPIINPKFRALIPPLSPDEVAQLEANLIADGCRDPLVTWKGQILDGHHRLEICERHSIKFKIAELNFETETQARIWIRSNQKGRRNLSDAWMIELELGNKADLLAIGKQKHAETSGRPITKPLSNNDNDLPKHNTQKQIASAAGVSTGKVAQAEIVRRKSPELWEQAKSGEITIGAAYKKVIVHVGQNSGDNEWCTPAQILDAARKAMISITCDPASSERANKTVRAKVFFTAEQDGLKQKWCGNVWMNPPYSSKLVSEFSQAVCKKLESGEIKQAIVLVNNATETAWFQRMLASASAVCLLKGRIKFITPDDLAKGTPLQGQVVFCLGCDQNLFAVAFESLGTVLFKV